MGMTSSIYRQGPKGDSNGGSSVVKRTKEAWTKKKQPKFVEKKTAIKPFRRGE